jgi:hypothetical protein
MKVLIPYTRSSRDEAMRKADSGARVDVEALDVSTRIEGDEEDGRVLGSVAQEKPTACDAEEGG